MLERLNAPDNLLAIRVSGHVSEAEIDLSIEWMDRGFAKHETLHVYGEVNDLSGVDPSGVVQGWLHGAHLMTQLRRFGRVAVVSEDRWIRVMARLESAVLPGISYRVFEPKDRGAAFAWVCGNA